MGLLYKVLGVAAAVNQYLWRHRINFVPLNLVLAGVASALLVFYATSWEEAVRNGATPRAIQLSALGSTPAGSFVRASGLLAPEAGFTYGEADDKGKPKTTDMEFIPLVDREAGTGVFVQVDRPGRFGKVMRDTEVTGMLRPMQEFLGRELRPKQFKHAGIRMFPSYVLVADEKPGDPMSAMLGVAVTGFVLLVFLMLTVKGNVIFRPAALLSEVVVPSVGENRLFATGTFLLDKHRKRFISVPTVLGTLDTGELAAFANVDASSNFMGVTYAKRAGIWVMPMPRGSMQGIEEGTLYFGRAALPSVRFQYTESASQKTRTAILSTSGGSSRALVAALTAASSSFAPRAANASPQALGSDTAAAV